jgi:flagellar basal body-associated protein FliL
MAGNTDEEKAKLFKTIRWVIIFIVIAVAFLFIMTCGVTMLNIMNK